jgi:hypothetical protein
MQDFFSKGKSLVMKVAGKKTTTWREFIRTHMEMVQATDFCSTEV